MKRHPSLEPFCRAHDATLLLARRLARGEDGAVEEFLHVWDSELQEHFSEEEKLLSPLCSPGQSSRIRSDHRSVSSYAEAARRGCLTKDQERQLGTLLHDHIMWEDRRCYPMIEASATAEQLDDLGRATMR